MTSAPAGTVIVFLSKAMPWATRFIVMPVTSGGTVTAEVGKVVVVTGWVVTWVVVAAGVVAAVVELAGGIEVVVDGTEMVGVEVLDVVGGGGVVVKEVTAVGVVGEGRAVVEGVVTTVEVVGVVVEVVN